MAIVNNQIIGTWYDTNIRAVFVTEGGTTKKYIMQDSVAWDMLVPRGKQIMQMAAAKFAEGITYADLADFESSPNNGLDSPAGVLTPTGYLTNINADGVFGFIVATQKDTWVDPVATAALAETGIVTRSATLLENPWEWAKQNPLPGTGLVIVIYMILVYVFAKTKAKRKKLSLGILG